MYSLLDGMFSIIYNHVNIYPYLYERCGQRSNFFFKKRKFIISVWIFIEAGRETLSWQKCLHTSVNKDLSKSLEMWVLVIAPPITVYIVWVSLLIPLPLRAFTHKIRTMLFIHSLLWNIGRPLSWNNWVTVSGRPHMQLSPSNPEGKT